MGAGGADLSVRRHERYLCDLPAAVAIDGASQGAIHLSRAALGPAGMIEVRVVDISRGGFGLSSRIYLPPSCRLRVQVRLPTPAGEKTLVVRMRAHRVAMADRTPLYYIGAAFEGQDAAQERLIQDVLAGLKAAGAQRVPEKARA
jgi:hypothetical protein